MGEEELTFTTSDLLGQDMYFFDAASLPEDAVVVVEAVCEDELFPDLQQQLEQVEMEPLESLHSFKRKMLEGFSYYFLLFGNSSVQI